MKVLRLCALVAALLLCASLSACGNVPAETITETEESKRTIASATAISNAETSSQYTLLQNTEEQYTGVLFINADGTEYQWESPVQSDLPIFVSAYNDSTDAQVVEYHIGGGEWLFDIVRPKTQEILYHHANEDGHRYTFGSGGKQQENGFIRYTDNWQIRYDRGAYEGEYDYSLFNSNRLLPIREILPLSANDKLPDVQQYTNVFATVPTDWSYDRESGNFYESEAPDGESTISVRRMSGLDILYYSETPIEEATVDGFLRLFNESDSHKISSTSADGASALDGHSKKYTITYFSDGTECFPDDPNAEEKAVDYKTVMFVQLDAHYFAKIEIYTYLLGPAMQGYQTAPLFESIMYY